MQSWRPKKSSSFLTCCSTAFGVTCSSAAARAKLPSRALASKALSAFSGGNFRAMVQGVLACAGSVPESACDPWLSHSHPCALGVEKGLGKDGRRPPLAQDLDL